MNHTNRIAGVMVMQARDRVSWLIIPASVLGAGFVIVLGIALSIHALWGDATPVYTGALTTVYFVIAFEAIRAVVGTFPFAVGFGARRRGYLLGTWYYFSRRGALVQFVPRYHLPPVISGHNAFYIWGPEGCTGKVLITINVDPQVAAQGYRSVTLAATTSCDACMDFENNAPILILRQPKSSQPFVALWPQIRHYD